MTLSALPIFVKVAGRPVMLIGEGEAAEAKRRLLERAGATIVGEDDAEARIAILACDAPEPIAARLRARGLIVNVVDRPELCDFTLPALIDRNPVLVAIGTGGVSAGLAAALRQRLEPLLPPGLGTLAQALGAARGAMRARWPDGGDRRRALGAALNGPLDPLRAQSDGAVQAWLERGAAPEGQRHHLILHSPDPDALTLGQARLLGQAERIFHGADVPAAILDRARADALRIRADTLPDAPGPGLSVLLEMAR